MGFDSLDLGGSHNTKFEIIQVSVTGDDKTDFFSKMYDKLPQWLRPEVG